MIQADKMKAGDLRVEHQQHQEQISKIKWDCERDIRRLVCPFPFLWRQLLSSWQMTQRLYCRAVLDHLFSLQHSDLLHFFSADKFKVYELSKEPRARRVL